MTIRCFCLWVLEAELGQCGLHVDHIYDFVNPSLGLCAYFHFLGCISPFCGNTGKAGFA